MIGVGGELRIRAPLPRRKYTAVYASRQETLDDLGRIAPPAGLRTEHVGDEANFHGGIKCITILTIVLFGKLRPSDFDCKTHDEDSTILLFLRFRRSGSEQCQVGC